MPPIKSFASYSHADSRLVVPVVALLRSSTALVFLDSDSIPPGTKWRSAIDDAIQDAQILVVFWCRHAQSSKEVTGEYKAAITSGKKVLPLLLDMTPLPTDLAAFQYIDCRKVFAHDDAGDGDRTVMITAPGVISSIGSASRMRWLVAASAALMALITVSWLSLRIPGPRDGEVRNRSVEVGARFEDYGAPLERASRMWFGMSLSVALVAVVVLLVALVSRAKIRASQTALREKAEQDVAGAVEREIIRRTASPP
jgi:hypothetical protein